MTNLPHIIETALLLLVAFLIGCILGYGLRRLTAVDAHNERSGNAAPVPPEPQPMVSSPPPAAVKPAAAKPAAKRPADPRPAALAAPRNGVKDDLKQIKGIGPRIETTLNDLGIYHHDQIAKWTKRNAAWVDEHLNFKGRIGHEKWIEQAKALSKG